ncbi:MAG: CapA family protein [Lachnospiraceae bacterium]|nr:CapA family protein [Lachnospiraceae bacterium]
MKLLRKRSGLLLLCMLTALISINLCSCQQKNKKAAADTKQSADSQNLPAHDEDTQTNQNDSPENGQNLSPEDSQNPLSDSNQPAENSPDTSPITLSFTGDVYLSEAMVNAYQQHGCAGIADAAVRSALADSDLTMINHEYASTHETQKVDYQIYNFRSEPQHEFILKELGVDIAGLSNNHILDYGVPGMQETIQTLRELGIDCAGAGSNIEEAKQAVIREIKGRRIAFVAVSHFVPDVSWHADSTTPGLLTTYEGTDNYRVLMDYISWLKQSAHADLVIIFAHYGVEKQNTFVPYQQQISRAWIDAGADLVVGSHAHVLQGMECYKGKYIFYNLGNFLFGNYEKETAVLQVEIDQENQIAVKLLPCVTKAFYVRTMNGQEADTLYRFLESVSVNVQVDTQGRVSQN